MPRYHVNPTTGKAGPCEAEEGNCPLGIDVPHGSNEIEAARAYEVYVSNDTDPETNDFTVLRKPKDLSVSLADAELGVVRTVDDFGFNDGSGRVEYKLPSGEYHRSDGPAILHTDRRGEYFLNGKTIPNLREYLTQAPESGLTRKHTEADKNILNNKKNYLALAKGNASVEERKIAIDKALRSLDYKAILYGPDIDVITQDEINNAEAEWAVEKAKIELEEHEHSLLGRFGKKDAKRQLAAAEKMQAETSRRLKETQMLLADPKLRRG